MDFIQKGFSCLLFLLAAWTSVAAHSGSFTYSYTSTPYHVAFPEACPIPNQGAREWTALQTDIPLPLPPFDSTASISYPQDTFCGVGLVTPTIVGDSLRTGIFLAVSGLDMQTPTGTINLANSIPGTYIISYVIPPPCSQTLTDTITILQADDAAFFYSPQVYCQGVDSIGLPVAISTIGGTFSYTPLFISDTLVIDPLTGAIDVNASTTGEFIVSYTTSGLCPDTATQTVKIVPFPQVTIFQVGDTLYAVGAEDFQWFQNGALLPDDSLNYLVPPGPGDYHVIGSNCGACSDTSDTVTITVANTLEGFLPGEVKVFPIPVDRELQVLLQLAGNGLVQYRIFNLWGQTVREGQWKTNGNYSLDLGDQAKGVYLLSLQQGTRGQVFRLVKQ